MSLKYVKKILLLACFSCFLAHKLTALPPAAGLNSTVPAGQILDLGAITGDPSSKYRTYFLPTHEVPLVDTNCKLLVGASVNGDYYFLRRAETLDANNKQDARSQFRQRTELTMLFKYGTSTESDRGIVDTRVTVGNTLFWRSLHNPIDYHNDQVIKGSVFDYNFSPMQTQFQEAWTQVNFDRLVPRIESRPHSLKIGYFPFLVGRGIALGDWSQGGVDYMGFNKSGVQTYAPMYPPGILWRGELTKYSGYDIYFSPLVTEDVVAANYGNAVQVKMPSDESLLNRHIFAASFKLGSEFENISEKIAVKNAFGIINPYWVYYNSPRQTVDRGGDAPISFHTFGCMAEISGGGFEVNVELAKQFGEQTIRERVYLEYPSIHHFDPRTGAFRALPTSIATAANITENANRRFPGDNVTLGGTTTPIYWQDQDKTKKLAEFHPEYKVNLSGWMAMFDARYSFQDYPVIIAAASGYFSGDNYPYNDNVDKFLAGTDSSVYTVDANNIATIKPEPQHEYRGFLPLRDRDYVGLWVHPLVLVNAGIVPRPKGIDLFDLSARNDSDTLTNLVYVGVGMAIRPLKDAEKLRLNANILSYWTDERLFKWDKKLAPPAMLKATEGGFADGSNQYDTYNIVGFESKDTASKHLGWEINGIASYKIAKNLDVSLRGGIFFPGQLYSDIATQPNIATIVDNPEIDSKKYGKVSQTTQYKGLGQDIAFGFYMRLRYVF